MIKECPIIVNNNAVTVIDFDGIQVQFPAIHTKQNKIKVRYDKKIDNYFLVLDEKSEKVLLKEEKDSNKKTTLKDDIVEGNFCEECRIESTD